jgi:hypothetical protein
MQKLRVFFIAAKIGKKVVIEKGLIVYLQVNMKKKEFAIWFISLMFM